MFIMVKGDIEILINLGFSQREIAVELDSSQSNVKYWLKKFGLKTNNLLRNKTSYSEKFCPKCKTVKPLDEFYDRSNRESKGGYCKKCSNKYHQKRVCEVKIKMIHHKGGQCVDCGLKLEDSHYSVFDFHHLDPNIKDSNFKRIKFQNWEFIKNEIDKCVLLCSNCHRIRHADELITRRLAQLE